MAFDTEYEKVLLTNIKSFLETRESDKQMQDKQRQGLQDSLNAFTLQVMGDQHTLIQRTADFNAALLGRVADQSNQVANRVAQNAAGLDHMLATLVAAGEIDNTALGSLGANIAKEVASTAKEAINSSIAGMATTGGVAQGALAAQQPIELAQILEANNTLQTAILKALVDVNNALGIILVRVTGEEVKPPTTPTAG